MAASSAATQAMNKKKTGSCIQSKWIGDCQSYHHSPNSHWLSQWVAGGEEAEDAHESRWRRQQPGLLWRLPEPRSLRHSWLFDMLELIGAATVLGSLMYGVGIWRQDLELYHQQEELETGMDDAKMVQLLRNAGPPWANQILPAAGVALAIPAEEDDVASVVFVASTGALFCQRAGESDSDALQLSEVFFCCIAELAIKPCRSSRSKLRGEFGIPRHLQNRKQKHNKATKKQQNKQKTKNRQVLECETRGEKRVKRPKRPNALICRTPGGSMRYP